MGMRRSVRVVLPSYRAGRGSQPCGLALGTVLEAVLGPATARLVAASAPASRTVTCLLTGNPSCPLNEPGQEGLRVLTGRAGRRTGAGCRPAGDAGAAGRRGRSRGWPGVPGRPRARPGRGAG